MIVYTHKNPQTRQIFYVGIGVDKQRAYKFKGKQRNQYWHNYVKKYGEPIVEIIAEFETREQAVELEMRLISKYGRLCDNSGCLVNITLGGDGGALGVKQSYDVIEKRAARLRGKTHTEQSKANMKAAQNRPEVKAKHAKFKADLNYRESQRQLKLGRKLTDEHKAKIGASLKGLKVSDSAKEKISIANKGRIRTKEQRKRISEGKKGLKRKQWAIDKAAQSNKKIVLNMQTGIYYKGLQDAANSIPMNLNTFRSKMAGHIKNNTPFVYA
jgi:hypothetical protein